MSSRFSGHLLAAIAPVMAAVVVLVGVVPASGAVVALGTIETVAGSVGHGPATSLGMYTSGVAIDGEVLYVGGGPVVRAIAVASGDTAVVAGNGARGSEGGPAVPAAGAMLDSVADVAVGPDGAVYIAELGGARIRRVAEGVMTTFAGTGVQGDAGDGGPALAAELFGPSGLAFGPDGSLYVADPATHRIRRIGPDGIIRPVAGTGEAGYGGDGGPATHARLNAPEAIAFDGAGRLYIADTGNHRIRRIDASGTITTVAGTGTAGFSGDGGPALLAQLDQPAGVVVDPEGRLLISDTFNNRIRRVASDGTISTIAGNDGAGYYFDGSSATLATLWRPGRLTVEAAGTVYIADQRNHRVRRLANGLLTTLAGNGEAMFSGDGGPAEEAQLDGPMAVTRGLNGELYVADSQNGRVRRIGPDGTIRTIAGNGDWFQESNGDGGPATDARLRLPFGVAVGPDGSVYVSEVSGSVVRRIAPGGVISTYAGTGEDGYSGDGGLASQAALNRPHGLAVDGAGNLYIADVMNQRIRRVSPMGIITTVAGTGVQGYAGDGGPAVQAALDHPSDVAVGPDGSLYIADVNNARVRRVANGSISTVAGSGSHGLPVCVSNGIRATDAAIVPDGIAVDDAGVLYISTRPGTIHRVDEDGRIWILAGDGGPRFWGDGAPATLAGVNWPKGLEAVSVDGVSRLYVADWGSNRIRRIDGSPPAVCTARLAGADRIATGVAVSDADFDPGTAGGVVLARGDTFPDALTGTPLAAAVQGPMLLTTSDRLDPSTEAEIVRVLPRGRTVHLLGGEAALAPAVERRLRDLGYRTRRHAGDDRFETAVAVAEYLGAPDVIIVTTGSDFPDAVTAGAVAASRNGVVLLTAGSDMPASTRGFIDGHGGVDRFAVGGPAARADGGATPVYGDDRFETAVAVAVRFFGGASTLGVVSGTAFPDALTGGAQLGRVNAPLLLTTRDGVPSATQEYLSGLGQVTVGRVYGGEAVISGATVQDISTLLR